MDDYRILVPTEQERILFLGENGSGKSTLARELLSCMSRYVAIDQKHDFPLRKGDVVVTKANDKRLWSGTEDKVIYRPGPIDGTGRNLDKTLARLYERGQRQGKTKPFVVYIDEALALAKTGSIQYLTAICVTGRSMGVGLWVCSQRPKSIPVEVRDQAWRIYVFWLGKRSDRKEVLEYLPDSYDLTDLERLSQLHSFIEIRRDPTIQGGRLVRYMPPIKRKLTSGK